MLSRVPIQPRRVPALKIAPNPFPTLTLPDTITGAQKRDKPAARGREHTRTHEKPQPSCQSWSSQNYLRGGAASLSPIRPHVHRLGATAEHRMRCRTAGTSRSRAGHRRQLSPRARMRSSPGWTARHSAACFRGLSPGRCSGSIAPPVASSPRVLSPRLARFVNGRMRYWCHGRPLSIFIRTREAAQASATTLAL